MTKKIEPAVKASMINTYFFSPFGFYCDFHGDKSKMDDVKSYEQEHMDSGIEYETAVCDEEYPKMEPISYTSYTDGFRKTLELMISGINVIHNPPMMYLPDGMIGTPDILERRDDKKSIFGSYYYAVQEIKNTNMTRHSYILQTAFYNMMLGKIQKYTPESFTIKTPSEETDYIHSDYKQSLLETLKSMKDIINGVKKPMPIYRAQRNHVWAEYETEQALEYGDISVVMDIGPKRHDFLQEAGITTIPELLKHSAEKIAEKTRNEIGIGLAQTILKSARVMYNKQYTRTDILPYNFKNNVTEIFLDLEGDSSSKYIYLIGMVVRKPHTYELEYFSFNEHACGGREKMARKFITFLNNIVGEYVIYHWTVYDYNGIRHLLNKHLKKQTEILSKFVDLHKIMRLQYVLPLHDRSLKTVEKYVGFERRPNEGVDAISSHGFYIDYVNDSIQNKPMLDKVLMYNEDDCVAMVPTLDWMIKHQ